MTVNMAVAYLGAPIIASGGCGAPALLLVMLPLAIYLMAKGAESLSKHLLIKHTPTSSCGGVSPGLVELKGTVVADAPLDSPLTDRKVVYYDHLVTEEVVDSSDKKKWETIAEESESAAFYLRDESGRVRINPGGAEIHPTEAVDREAGPNHSLHRNISRSQLPNSTGNRKFKEEHIAVGTEVYVLGTARARADLGIPEIYGGDEDDPFIISTREEGEHSDQYYGYAVAQLAIGGLLATAVPVVGTMAVESVSFGQALQAAILPTFIIGLGVVVLIWSIYRVKHSEHLGNLRRKIKEARTILQRECEHREKLLLRVATKIRAVTDRNNKQWIDDWLEERRRRGLPPSRTATVQRICNTIDDQTEIFEALFAMAEDTPKIQSDRSFYLLLEELTRCEKQMMMARNFYNDGVWRLTRQPEGATGELSSSAGSPMPAMTFRRFETKPVDVILPEDPDSEYAGDFERNTTESPRPSQSSQPSAPSAPPDLPAPWEDSANSGQEDDESLSVPAPSVPATPPVPQKATDYGVTMDFGNVTDAFEPSSFAGVGSFGDSRRFDDIGRNWSDDRREEREPYGFGTGERAFLESSQWPTFEDAAQREPFGFGKGERAFLERSRWPTFEDAAQREPFGFSDKDRRSVLDAFRDE